MICRTRALLTKRNPLVIQRSSIFRGFASEAVSSTALLTKRNPLVIQRSSIFRGFASEAVSSSSYSSNQSNIQQATTLFQEAQTFFENSDLKRALLAFEECAKLSSVLSKNNDGTISNKLCADSYYNMGNCHLMNKEYQKALESYEKSVSFEQSCDAFTNAANILAIHLNNTTKAIEYFEKAIALQPEDGQVRFNYGVVLESMSKFQEAISEYESAQKFGVERASENIRNAKAKLLVESIKSKKKD